MENKYTESDLIHFGNFLLLTYNVMVYSNDGKNIPIYERSVTDADLSNWKELKEPLFGERSYNIGDKVKVFLMPEGENEFPGFNATILTVHQYVGKCKYDLEIKFAGDFSTRIYNIDEVLISKN